MRYIVCWKAPNGYHGHGEPLSDYLVAQAWVDYMVRQKDGFSYWIAQVAV